MRNNALSARGLRVLDRPSGEPVLLRDEREKRRQGRKEFAERVQALGGQLTVRWLIDIEEHGKRPGKETAAAIRLALAECPIHRDFGVACTHALPVPPDDALYAPSKVKTG